ncbi:hypothetical protein F8388_021119 [Cannabis sativa]|uniref:Ubiquitin-like protease family profile domain-containing protein n=1 Tax=Cannabis sativa TaxID=3483 RepID=A0A7J6EJR0_CANSA|nr:hypothetical protein G4B88_019997 [Cannabis sativa]KAF4388289.1 hypothetical protein F8388_021119 [Cannabis sativa]
MTQRICLLRKPSPLLHTSHDKDKVYLKDKDKIVPPFRFGVKDVASKMWFHKLAYPGQWFTNSDNKLISLDPFDVVKVDGLPQQTSNDCGCFVASFVEYFIDMKPIPPIFDVEKHRDRLAVLFFKYARMKEVNFIDSKDEAPPKGP